MTYNRIILCTTASEESARKIARALVEQRLAACVNIVPRVQSVYRWQQKVETAEEWLLVIKTSQKRYKAVEALIQELHTYELPEVVSVAIEGGSREYLRWLEEAVASAKQAKKK
jgi:periplasmic divalent cation tolerance protein